MTKLPRWTWLALAGVAAAGSVVVLLVGYMGVRSEPVVAAQIPYVETGIGTAVLLMLVAVAFFTADHRARSQRSIEDHLLSLRGDVDSILELLDGAGGRSNGQGLRPGAGRNRQPKSRTSLRVQADDGPGSGGNGEHVDLRQVGRGERTFRASSAVRGEVRHVRNPANVLDLVKDPPQVQRAILVAEDAGATFLSPLFPMAPRGVICTEGTPKSHLGIVTREFEIPCLMGVELEHALDEGEEVELRFGRGKEGTLWSVMSKSKI